MNKLKSITRYALYMVLFFVLFSCDTGEPTISYTEKTVSQFNKLKSPVTLFAKEDSMVGYDVQLMDGDNVLHYFGNMSGLANSIGSNYKIGDTLK